MTLGTSVAWQRWQGSDETTNTGDRMSRIEARKLAMMWKRRDGGQWPAVKIYPRDDGVRLGCQQVRLGYTDSVGEFVEVVRLRFGSAPEPVFVRDRRAIKDHWPSAWGTVGTP